MELLPLDQWRNGSSCHGSAQDVIFHLAPVKHSMQQAHPGCCISKLNMLMSHPPLRPFHSLLQPLAQVTCCCCLFTDTGTEEGSRSEDCHLVQAPFRN